MLGQHLSSISSSIAKLYKHKEELYILAPKCTQYIHGILWECLQPRRYIAQHHTTSSFGWRGDFSAIYGPLNPESRYVFAAGCCFEPGATTGEYILKSKLNICQLRFTGTTKCSKANNP